MATLLSKITNFKWVPTSDDALASAESALLSNIGGGYHRYVVATPQCDINTISSVPQGGHSTDATGAAAPTSAATAPPRDVVLFLHGFGFGLVQWIPNWAEVAKVADVYAIDMPGFGRSGRPKISGSIAKDEALIFLIQAVEEWYKAVFLHASPQTAVADGGAAAGDSTRPPPRLVIVGHSFGGYIGGKFAVQYPHRVQKLILVDPFGLDRPPSEDIDARLADKSRTQRAAIWAAKTIFYSIGTPAFLRALGPVGAEVFHGRKGDRLTQQWAPVIANPKAVADYVYHSNVRGELGWYLLSKLVHGMGAGIGEGFHILMPLKDDLCTRLSPDIALAFVLGAHSWIPGFPAEAIAAHRTARFGTEVHVEVLSRAGHHVYLDRHHRVNELLVEWITGAK